MEKNLDLIKLSDIFRRENSNIREADLMWDIVTLTRQVGVRATYYRGELSESHYYNKDVLKEIFSDLKEILECANILGKEKIILPFSSGNIFSQPLLEMLRAAEIAHRFELREEEYSLDLKKEFGDIQKSVPTILDVGVRGLCSINYEIKRKWDFPEAREPA